MQTELNQPDGFIYQREIMRFDWLSLHFTSGLYKWLHFAFVNCHLGSFYFIKA